MKASNLFTDLEIKQYEIWLLAEQAKASKNHEDAIDSGNISREYAAEARMSELKMALRMLQAYKSFL